MKTCQINIFLLLLVLSGNSYCQFIYLGRPSQKVSIAANALIKLKQDTLYVPTQDGLFKKPVMSNDTLWMPAGFQGMKINDFALIGNDTLVCVIDSTEGNTIFVSGNGGSSFTNSTNGFGGTGVDFQPGFRVDVNPNNHHEIIAMSGSCVARSDDFCESWTPVYLTWGYSVYQPTVLRYHPLNSTLIYSGGELSLFDSYLSYSFDSGTTWQTSAVESNNAVNGIAFHPGNVDTLFIGKEGKIARSIDKGLTWSEVYATPHYEYIYSIIYDKSNSSTIYAAGAINGLNDTIRIFRSLDGGSTWEEWVKEIFSESDNQIISMIMYNTFLCVLMRDHFGNIQGVYKLNTSTVPVPEIIENTQVKIFPNPFSSETTLQADPPLKNATLTVENSLGQTVKQIKNISAQPVILTRGNLPNGLYFVRLKEEKKVLTEKLIITDNF